MRPECQQFVGRLRDLCDGVGYDGRPNPTQQATNNFRSRNGLEPITVDNPAAAIARPIDPPPPQVSQIGTRLANFFRDRIDAIPCDDCKAAILSLNSMTVTQVRAVHDAVVKQIAMRAVVASPNWWTKYLVKVDQFLHIGGTEYLIGVYLKEACDMEEADGTK